MKKLFALLFAEVILLIIGVSVDRMISFVPTSAFVAMGIVFALVQQSASTGRNSVHGVRCSSMFDWGAILLMQRLKFVLGCYIRKSRN